MITQLVLVGATGDLAGRFLLPALARLVAGGRLPARLQIVGAAPQGEDDDSFRRLVAARWQEHAPEVPDELRQRLLQAVRYRRVDLDDASSVAGAVGAFEPRDGTPVAVYLALPPALFPAAIAALDTAELPAGSRIAVEKPFGEDLAGAAGLNAQLTRVRGAAAEQAVFRVDHALGMPALQKLHRERAGLEPVWNGARIEQVDVLWEETLALEGRADFYDRTGAVKDVLQNHMLQVLALVAMELPATGSGADLHAAKLDLLRAVRPITPDRLSAGTRRARYTAGPLAGSGVSVPDYAEEVGVDPDRGTETYAELVLEVDRPRWAGTRFVLRAGKALAEPRKGIRLHFRSPAPALDPHYPVSTSGREVWIGLDEPQPGGPAAGPLVGELEAYGEVLLDLLSDGRLLSVSSEEAEASWRIVEPVLQAWAGGAVPLLEYPAGSAGPGHLPQG